MNYYVNVTTQEDYNTIIEILDKKGFKFITGSKINKKNHWLKHKEDTLIAVFDYVSEVCISNINYHPNLRGQIITLKQFLN